MKDVAKSGWASKPLASFAKTGAGGTPKKSNKAFYEGGDIPWLLSGEVANANIMEAKNFITAEGLKGSSAKLFPPNSVLVAMYGATAGEVGILRFEAATNQAVCAVLPSDEHIPEYLYYYLLHAKPSLVAQAVGNAQPNISQAKIKSIEIPLPSLEEQQRIVAVLDEAFEGLARARAHAEANLQNAQEFFDNALLAMMTEIDQASPRLSLSDAAKDFGRGRSRHRPRNAPFLYGGPYPFIQTGDIRNASGRLKEFSQTYSEEGLSQSKLWPAGTVCITIAANIAETAVMCFEGCFPDSVIGMVPDEQVTFPEFVEYMLRFFAADLKAQGKGSAQDNINLSTFEKATFPFPPIDQQREVVSKLDDLWSSSSDLVTAYSNKIDDIDDLRQSLLQKAFAGELI